ncbi:MAG: 3-phosphoglycerate dehydrogenase [Acidimicrobiia bacterium]|nr:3-phosphoglycerate dehydrogenase [Acidimicrobiia bacterium]
MASAHRALVTAPFRGEGLDTLKELADVVLDPWIDYVPLRILDGPKLADRLKEEGADILIVESDFVGDPVYDLPLVAIGSCRGDPNNVDVAGATKAGIPVLRAPGRNADAVAEIAVALLFAASRHVIPADQDVRSDTVFKDDTIPYQRYRAWQIAGQTAGLVGLGAVGRALRWRLEGLGMKVVAYDPYADDAKESLEEVLDQADVISLHAAVTPETTAMISTDQFASMKDGVVFLNTAREALHDRDALVAALQSGKVAAAGLDHFTGERLDTDHPLTSMSNVVLTPHIGGATYDTESNHSRLIADDIARLLAGERPLHIVNPEVLK